MHEVEREYESNHHYFRRLNRRGPGGAGLSIGSWGGMRGAWRRNSVAKIVARLTYARGRCVDGAPGRRIDFTATMQSCWRPWSSSFSVAEKLARCAYRSSALSKELFQELGWVLKVVAEIDALTPSKKADRYGRPDRRAYNALSSGLRLRLAWSS